MTSSDSHEITKCEPLNSMEEVMLFLDYPPPWRSLCIELKPHCDMKIINMSVNAVSAISVEEPRTFCHTNLALKPVINSMIGVRQDKKSLPKTLVCHDMANGYHDDSIVQGTSNFDQYTFYNWAGIDIFCYFSHHFVTIPPLGWINVAHAHGVKVIGTVITEWSSGTKFWDELLMNETQWKNFASVLVGIAKTLKFEGWLLNIENKVSEPQKLIAFVQYLHGKLHEEILDAELIWYDSVTVQGNLDWQNGLTDKNREFFEACDGLFTNYSWSVENIVNSMQLAGDRSRDLYIGVDVWGRNFFGGGMFNTQQAIDVTYQFDCSVAIFAPAWTYEAREEPNSPETSLMKALNIPNYEKFYLRDRAFWDSLWPYLYTSLPSKLPFQTSFCRGHGFKYWHYGEPVSEDPWYKLIRMQYQPNSNHGPHGYMLTTEDNFNHITESGIDITTAGGIVKYRRSFIIHQRSKEGFKDETDTPNKDLNKSVGTIIPDPAEFTLKRKIKCFFASIFGQKKTPQPNEITNTGDGYRRVNQPSKSDGTETMPPKKTVEIDAPSTSREIRDTLQESYAVIEETLSSNTLKSVESLQPKIGGKFEVSKKSLRKVTRLDSLHIMLRGGTLKNKYALAVVPHELPCIQQYFQDGFNGGSCLKINPSDDAWPTHRLIRLFYCHFRIVQPLVFCVVTKTLIENENQYLNVHLHLKKNDGRSIELRLLGKDNNKPMNKPEKVYANAEIYNLYALPQNSKLFKNLQNYLLLSDPGFYIPVNNIYGWKVRYFEFTMPWAKIQTIDLVTSRTKGPILLGYLGITERNPSSETVTDSIDDINENTLEEI